MSLSSDWETMTNDLGDVFREAGNIVMDVAGIFFPNEINKVQRALNEDVRKGLEMAYELALKTKGQLDQQEAVRLDKYINDMAIWMQKLNTGSRNVRKAYSKHISKARQEDSKARQKYNQDSVNVAVDIETLADAKNRPEAYVVGDDLLQDIHDVMSQYGQTSGIASDKTRPDSSDIRERKSNNKAGATTNENSKKKRPDSSEIRMRKGR